LVINITTFGGALRSLTGILTEEIGFLTNIVDTTIRGTVLNSATS
jgi:hypothetical protein